MGLLKADVVVIGGGAAGSMCALTAAQRGLSVVLLEPNKMLGRKVRMTQGRKTGRIELEYYDADDREALLQALEAIGRRN